MKHIKNDEDYSFLVIVQRYIVDDKYFFRILQINNQHE